GLESLRPTFGEAAVVVFIQGLEDVGADCVLSAQAGTLGLGDVRHADVALAVGAGVAELESVRHSDGTIPQWQEPGREQVQRLGRAYRPQYLLEVAEDDLKLGAVCRREGTDRPVAYAATPRGVLVKQRVDAVQIVRP